MESLIVIAIGGNAILKENQVGTVEEQFANVMECCCPIADLYAQGYRIVIVHGNGPQVGNILLQVEAAAETVSPQTIDLCGAQTQGQLGYMIQQSLHNVWANTDAKGMVSTVVTQVLVDRDDPAFQNPTKPIGPFYSKDRAQQLQREHPGIVMKEDAGRGYRRVVPSPKPIGMIERDSVRSLLDRGHVVITGGGGGVPIIREKNKMIGVEAVIDKDLVAALIATDLHADHLVILTGVEQVYVDFGKPTQRPIRRMTVSEAQVWLEEGQFPAGSMKPKIEAALGYLANGGTEVIITSTDKLIQAIKGETGTAICRDAE